MRNLLAIVSALIFGLPAAAGLATAWEMTWDSGWRDEGRAIVLAPSGQIYLAGRTVRNLSDSHHDLSIVQVSPDGAANWRATVPYGYGLIRPVALAVDSADNLLVSALVLGGRQNYHYSLSKFGSIGQRRWGEIYSDSRFTIAVDAEDNLYLSSTPAKKVSPGGGVLWERSLTPRYVTLDPQGSPIFWGQNGLTKLSPSGETLWNRMDMPILGLRVAPSGNIYVGSTTNRPDNFLYTRNGFVAAKYAPDGQLLWRRVYSIRRWQDEGGAPNFLSALEIDADENVYLGGNLKGLYARGGARVFKFDRDGNFQWRTSLGRERGIRLLPDPMMMGPDQNLYFAPELYFEASFMVAQIDQNGTIRTTIEGPPPSVPAIQIDASTNLFVLTTTGENDALDFRLTKYVSDENPDEPIVRNGPRDHVIEIGSEYRVRIELEGGAGLSYQWHKDGEAILGATEREFRIARVTQSDTGAYSVRVTFSGGSLLSSESLLTVNVWSINLRASLQGPGVIRVEFSGEPGSTYYLQSSPDLRIWTNESIIPDAAQANTISFPMRDPAAAFLRIVRLF